MTLLDYVNFILPFVYVLVGICLVGVLVAIIQLVVTINKSLKPTLDNVQNMMEELEPTIKRIDPIVAQVNPMIDRVSLTVDAANLEIMRIDTILEDVGNITNTAASAVGAMDKITNAPLNAISGVASKITGAVTGRATSDESRDLADEKVRAAHAKTEVERTPAHQRIEPIENPIPKTGAVL